MQFGNTPRYEQEHEGNRRSGEAGYIGNKVSQTLQTPTERYGVFGRVEVHEDGKKYLMRPSMRLGRDGKTPEEFAQKIPIVSLEVNGETKELLGLPLENMALTPDQKKKFKEAGGFEIDCSKMTPEEQRQFSGEYPEAPIDWQESFETLESEIDGIIYKGFDLFKKVYEAFPDIRSMTKEEATEVGLYPIINYRNFAARKWMAEMNGGYLATLNKDYNGELRGIYNAVEGETNLQKLAAMGQAPLGWRGADDAEVYNLGLWVELGSGSLYGGNVYTLGARRGLAFAVNYGCWQRGAVSSVVVLDKYLHSNIKRNTLETISPK